MTFKYKEGAKVKVLHTHYEPEDSPRNGEIGTLLHSKKWIGSYQFKGYRDHGLPKNAIENESKFEPIKLTLKSILQDM